LDPVLSGQVWIRYVVRASESVRPQRRSVGPRRPRTRGEADWAAPWIWLKCRFLNKKFFSFSNLFYKLQINLNSNQI
jgi:hypothetical protein